MFYIALAFGRGTLDKIQSNLYLLNINSFVTNYDKRLNIIILLLMFISAISSFLISSYNQTDIKT